ncbi:MAG: 6-phosphogluconolactonase [Candidatus Hydrogenedentes bacterium]|nr:6-phosphogluconolactonase [Candidatus Hydrogenedentota bacterium]
MKTIVDANPAARLAKDLVAYVNTLDHAHIAVSGGSTPRALFKILASEYRRAARWDRVTIWQVDERTVPPTDSLSNWKMIQEELLSQIIELKSHRMEAERLSAADDYETLLRTHQIKLDLVLLGMGADGHTASLFPGTAGLEERDRLVVRNEIPQLTTHRVTMTFPFINAARERWFLVAGADKADAFNRVLQGELPAARVPDPAWYVDPAAIGQ